MQAHQQNPVPDTGIGSLPPGSVFTFGAPVLRLSTPLQQAVSKAGLLALRFRDTVPFLLAKHSNRGRNVVMDPWLRTHVPVASLSLHLF